MFDTIALDGLAHILGVVIGFVCCGFLDWLLIVLGLVYALFS